MKVYNEAILVKKIGFGNTDNYTSIRLVVAHNDFNLLQDRLKASN